MAYTKSELMRISGTDSAQFLGWSGHPGLYLRVKLDPSLPGAPHRGVSRNWYWRGTLNHSARQRGLQPEKLWLALGDAYSGVLTDEWLTEEAHRLKRACRLGIDPRVTETVPEETEETDTLDEAWAKFLSSDEKSRISENYRDDLTRKWAYSVGRLQVQVGGTKRIPIRQVLGSVRMNNLRIDFFDEFFRALADRPVARNRMLRILNEFMGWAQPRYPEMPSNLVSGREFFLEEADEDRLWEDELIRFGKVWRQKDFYRQRWNILFLLLTGCRSGVLIHWDPSWHKGDFLEIPRGTPGLKNSRSSIYVPLPPVVQSIIPNLVRCSSKGLEGCVTNLCRWAKIQRDRPTILTPHHLRHTYISVGCDQGELEEVMLSMTQHRSRNQIGRVYNHREVQKYLPIAARVADYLWELLHRG